MTLAGFGTHLIIVGFIIGMESSQTCIWRFHSCNRSSQEGACNIIQRQWCLCNRTAQNDSDTQNGFCEASDLRVLKPNDSETVVNIPFEENNLCNRSVCEVADTMCQWETWTLTSSPRCGHNIQQRRRFKCCHPVTKRRLDKQCKSYEWGHRYRYRVCDKRDFPSGNKSVVRGDEGEKELKDPMTKVVFVLCGFGVFILVAAIIGKRVGRPLCQTRRRGRRPSPPIVIELPSKRKAPAGVIIPEPGQPLTEYEGR